MVGIEAKRFARHPLFIIGVLAAYGVTALVVITDTVSDGNREYSEALLASPVVPAFFIGLTSLVVAARLTRSTEVAVEAMGTAPGTEARRSLAVAGACAVPLVAGIGWLVELFVFVSWRGPHPHELWFPLVNDLYVWCILLSLAAVSCLGGGLVGVLVGRWLRFRGAAPVSVVGLVLVVMVGQLFYAHDPELSKFRLWEPWAMWHSGTMSDGKAWEGIPGYAQGLYAGNPFWYLLYTLALCALAVGGAVWHDRTARTPALRVRLYGLIGLTLGLLALAMFTGMEGITISEPLPHVGD